MAQHETVQSTDATDFQFLAENSVDIVCRCDMDTTMRYVSPSSLRILGWLPTQMLGRRMDEFILAEDLPDLVKAVGYANSPGVGMASATLRMRRRDGTTCWLEISAAIVRDTSTGEAQSAAVIMRDVSERKKFEEQLAFLAMTDSLTGLSNRRAFDQALERDWQQTLRDGSQMSLLLLDIDHFKSFNDLYGHQFGDDCLRAVANAVRSVARRVVDTAARYGGEEMAVILFGVDGGGALQIAETLRQTIVDLRIPHAIAEAANGLVTVSVGVATALARQGGTIRMPESILMSADMALYRAKHEGRNRVASMHLMAAGT